MIELSIVVPDYCPAVLRPEGIACTLPRGHGRYRADDGVSYDHCNVARPFIGGKLTREGIKEWGFNNPRDRKLESMSTVMGMEL